MSNDTSPQPPVKFELPGEVTPEKLYRPDALAERLGVSERVVDDMIRDGLPTRNRQGFKGRWVLGSDFIEWTTVSKKSPA